MSDDVVETLLVDADRAGWPDDRAPSRLKARVYSALMRQQSASGPLLALSETRETGRGLCVFESVTSASPVGEAMKQRNLCRVCHARVLAEQIEGAPIFWHNCPYVDFQH